MTYTLSFRPREQRDRAEASVETGVNSLLTTPQIPSMKGDVKGVPFPTSVSLALTSESPMTLSRVIIPETMTCRF